MAIGMKKVAKQFGFHFMVRSIKKSAPYGVIWAKWDKDQLWLCDSDTSLYCNRTGR